jgi:hypothetical protein
MDFDTLLGQIEASRPDLSESFALIRQFQKQKKENADAEEVDTDKMNELSALVEKQKRINKNLFQQYDELKNNYQLLIQQLDTMAEAVGACPQCWGEDVTCNYCKGRGKPGNFQPNQQAFDYYIKPVILKLKTSKS